MKTSPQTNDERKLLCRLIEPIPVAMMTTRDADGLLVSRPMAPLEMDADGSLWFFTDRRSGKVEQLDSVCLTFADAEHSTYVSLSGHGELKTDRAHVERLWSAAARPWFPDGPDSEHLALLKVVPEVAEYWDAPSSRMVALFAMAASVMAGRPIGLGSHDKLESLGKRPAPPSAR